MVSKQQVELIKTRFDATVDGCCGIQQIHKVHCVRAIGPYKMMHYSVMSDDSGIELTFRDLSDEEPSADTHTVTMENEQAVAVLTPVKFADCVVVPFAGKETVKNYMGQIADDKDQDDRLKKSGNTFCWLSVEDMSVITRQVVLRKVGEPPQLDKHHHHLKFAEKHEVE